MRTYRPRAWRPIGHFDGRELGPLRPGRVAETDWRHGEFDREFPEAGQGGELCGDEGGGGEDGGEESVGERED